LRLLCIAMTRAFTPLNSFVLTTYSGFWKRSANQRRRPPLTISEGCSRSFVFTNDGQSGAGHIDDAIEARVDERLEPLRTQLLEGRNIAVARLVQDDIATPNACIVTVTSLGDHLATRRSPDASTVSAIFRRRHQTVGIVPPSMTNSVPVMDDARSDAIKATSSATSRGLLGRPSGMPPSMSISFCRASA
jgi:hypothetical protein